MTIIFELWVGGGMGNIFLNVILRNKSAPIDQTQKYRNPITKN